MNESSSNSTLPRVSSSGEKQITDQQKKESSQNVNEDQQTYYEFKNNRSKSHTYFWLSHSTKKLSKLVKNQNQTGAVKIFNSVNMENKVFKILQKLVELILNYSSKFFVS